MSHPLALAHVTDPVFFLQPDHWSEGCRLARESPRRRIALPVHRQISDRVQRLFNFLQPETYIAPHHHPAEGFSETILALQGCLLFLEFSPDGTVITHRILEAGTPHCLVDFVGSCLHAFVCLVPDTVVLEIKQGPFVAASDKVFAPWAPAEGDARARLYLEELRALATTPSTGNAAQ
jgi:cupin fold WbuC family metalloprotein